MLYLEKKSQEQEKESGIVPLLALPLIIKDLVKRVRTAGREYDDMDKCF